MSRASQRILGTVKMPYNIPFTQNLICSRQKQQRRLHFCGHRLLLHL